MIVLFEDFRKRIFYWILLVFLTIPYIGQAQSDNNSSVKATGKFASPLVIERILPFQDVDIEDYRIPFQMDSAWQRKLEDSKLYRQVYASVHRPINIINRKADRGLSKSTLKKRLRALDKKTPFELTYNKELESWIHRYLHRDRKLMAKLLTRGLYFFPLFEEELSRAGLPLELKYLPVIESALNPKAKSRMGAVGLWQFIFSTAKIQGLTISNYVDERMDPVRSTRAAVKYLKGLYDIFGDWNLALAAYNSGPGNVSKAIRRSGGETDYWKIKKYLPKETANYVPAFLATLYIFNYAEEHGFKPNPPMAMFYETDTIKVKRPVDFSQISNDLGVERKLIEFLNPQYKLDVVPNITGKEYTLRLPLKYTGVFVSNENQMYDDAEEAIAQRRLPAYRETQNRTWYTIRQGDYLGKIAKKFGVSVASIKKWNHMRSNRIRAGKRLMIYRNSSLHSVKILKHSGGEKGVRLASKDADRKAKTFYVIQKGDTLWDISKKFKGVSVTDLKKWNDIRGNQLKPGTKLKIY